MVVDWFLLDSHKQNAENDYFYQRLECTTPKRWLKYTTHTHTHTHTLCFFILFIQTRHKAKSKTILTASLWTLVHISCYAKWSLNAVPPTPIQPPAGKLFTYFLSLAGHELLVVEVLSR